MRFGVTPTWQQNGGLTVLQNPSLNSVADDPKKGGYSDHLGVSVGVSEV